MSQGRRIDLVGLSETIQKIHAVTHHVRHALNSATGFTTQVLGACCDAYPGLPGCLAFVPSGSSVSAVLYLDTVAGLTCTRVQGRRIQASVRAYIMRVGVSGPFLYCGGTQRHWVTNVPLAAELGVSAPGFCRRNDWHPVPSIRAVALRSFASHRGQL
ncbi:hypothetical protein G3M48_002605, partial [Beauveria asiatica]